MIVARTMANPALADELRAACMTVALDLGGWTKKKKSKHDISQRPKLRRATAF
jgi:hypothetical protein